MGMEGKSKGQNYQQNYTSYTPPQYTPPPQPQPVKNVTPQQEKPKEVYCPNCGHPNPEGNKFCGKCGKKIYQQESFNSKNEEVVESDSDKRQDKKESKNRFCPECGSKISNRAIYCPECGKKI